MRSLVLPAALALAPLPLWADQYYMGAGSWTCDQFVQRIDSGDGGLTAQAAGFVMGFWSAATLNNGDAFTDLVEQTGGRAIFEATYKACQGNGSVLVGDLARKMLDDTLKGLN